MASLITVGQVLDQSFEHCRKHFKELLAITLWMVVASIPSVLGNILQPSGFALSFTLTVLGTIVVAVVSLWMYAALTLAVADQAASKRTTLKQTYREAWKMFFPYLGLTILLAVIVLSFAALAVPGYGLLVYSSTSGAPQAMAAIAPIVFFAGGLTAMVMIAKYTIQLAFAPYFLLLDDHGVINAIKASNALVRGRWWSTMLRYAIPKLIYFIVIFFVSFIVLTGLELIFALLTDTSEVLALLVYVFSMMVSVLFSAVATPLLITTDFYLYESLKKTR